MPWELVIALVIAIPVILFPAAFIWYMNIGGIVAAVRDAKAKRITRRETSRLAEAASRK